MSDVRISVKLENNSKIVIDEMRAKMEDALYVMGVTSVAGANEAISGASGIAPAIDTGRLRASISFITPTREGVNKVSAEEAAKLKVGDTLKGSADKNTVVVGSNVEYAEYVHDGTSKMVGRPFLRVGIESVLDKMERLVQNVFEDK